jgi:Flp pilus assembly pilin Flp
MSGLHTLRDDEAGVTVVEFALIAPVLLVMVMGLFDMGYTMYVNSMLQGAIQKVARDSTIEGAAGSTAALDQRVTDAVKTVVFHSTLNFSRKSYASFSDVSQPEDFTDLDSDGDCNSGEPYEDANGNGTWDEDRGVAGQGGARDAVLYSVRVTYARPFPIASLIGQDDTFTLESSTVLRNQPYGLTGSSAPATGNCP